MLTFFKKKRYSYKEKYFFCFQKRNCIFIGMSIYCKNVLFGGGPSLIKQFDS